MEIVLDRLKTFNFTKVFLVILILIVLIFVFNIYLPPAEDWSNLYRPASAALAAGRSPYEIERFTNAPWVLLPMLPLLILPESLGRAILALATLISLSLICIKFGAKRIGLTFVLLSPPVIALMLDGNIDWLVAIGFILPPQIGLFFLAIKPQIGIAVAFFWLIHTWRTSGIQGVIKVFALVSVALIISFLLFGLWPLKFSFFAVATGGNISLWPMSIPIGLALSITAIRKQNISYAIAASPCFSPYVLMHSWIGPLLVLVSATPEIIAAIIGLWLVVGMWGVKN